MQLKTMILASMLVTVAAGTATAEVTFRHALEGMPLDLSVAKDYKNPSGAVKQFLESGDNPYNCDKKAVEEGHSLFLSACSGCHGHEAEGKLGPGLADDYWTYPAGLTDKGLFEIIFGGAQGMMGPQYGNLSMDEMLKIMAFLRSIYKGNPRKIEWKTCNAAADGGSSGEQKGIIHIKPQS
ncbi:cytochrome c-L [Methylomarinovum tepidoasis]|uniref:Cytochrome c-L n=1 Tax=Methylomarinovum tepidoasis TaxID=2840183 RepID=A0AAU9CBB6_9GAMM|nr:cytochrome c(L), periplasmic [Methylomarinovum sp. IN45]BCX89252.1 cytochrome c-L [Methylomarinovum sp. IN45]